MVEPKTTTLCDNCDKLKLILGNKEDINTEIEALKAEITTNAENPFEPIKNLLDKLAKEIDTSHSNEVNKTSYKYAQRPAELLAIGTTKLLLGVVAATSIVSGVSIMAIAKMSEVLAHGASLGKIKFQNKNVKDSHNPLLHIGYAIKGLGDKLSHLAIKTKFKEHKSKNAKIYVDIEKVIKEKRNSPNKGPSPAR